MNKIYDRVYEMKKQNKVEYSKIGLIIVNEVTAYKRTLYPVLHKMNWKANISSDAAYRTGKADGNNIGLNRQFGIKYIY